MDNTVLKTAMIAVLESMTNEELVMLQTDLVIMQYDHWASELATLVREALECQSTADHLLSKAEASHWTEVYKDTLDSLWSLYDDPSEKNKAVLSWLAEQQ